MLKQKINELSLLFENQDIPIESLRTLEFKYKQPKKKFPTPKKETVIDEEIEDKTEEYEEVNNDNTNDEE